MVSLVLDFADLEYISSAGLRLLVQLVKMMEKRNGMKVIHVRSTVLEVFRTVMFDNILDIEQETIRLPKPLSWSNSIEGKGE